MSELSPRARAIIDAARGVDEPTPADKERVREAILARIGPVHRNPDTAHEASSNLAPRTEPASSATPSGIKALGTKILVGAAIIGCIGLGGYLLMRGGQTGPDVDAQATMPAILAEPSSPARGSHASEPGSASNSERAPARDDSSDKAEQEVEDVEFGPVAVADSEHRQGTRPGQPRARKKTTASQPPDSAAAPGELRPAEGGDAEIMDPEVSLKQEHQLIASAKRALEQGNPDKALSVLATHEERFPNGLLTEERAALRVLALCERGDVDQARREQGRFLDKWPRSPHANRIRSACTD